MLDITHLLLTSMTWDYSKKDYRKQAKADPVWKLERFINYGAPKMKLRLSELKKMLPSLRIPEDRRAFLSLLIWKKRTF